MPADHSLLRISLTPIRQAFAIGARAYSLHHALDDALGDHRCALRLRLVGGDGGEHFVLLLFLVGEELRVERLRQLRAVAIERVGFQREPPGEEIGLLAVGDGRIVRHVDGLGDGAGDERLRRRHHADMAVDRQIALALAPARRGAVEHRQMPGIEPRRPFERHRPAGKFVGGLDLALAEADLGQEVEISLIQPLGLKPKRGREKVLAQRPFVENEFDVEGRRHGLLDRSDLLRREAARREALVVDARRA